MITAYWLGYMGYHASHAMCRRGTDYEKLRNCRANLDAAQGIVTAMLDTMILMDSNQTYLCEVIVLQSCHIDVFDGPDTCGVTLLFFYSEVHVVGSWNIWEREPGRYKAAAVWPVHPVNSIACVFVHSRLCLFACVCEHSCDNY